MWHKNSKQISYLAFNFIFIVLSLNYDQYEVHFAEVKYGRTNDLRMLYVNVGREIFSMEEVGRSDDFQIS